MAIQKKLDPTRLQMFGGGVEKSIGRKPLDQAASKQLSLPPPLSAIGGGAAAKIAPDVRPAGSKVVVNGASQARAAEADRRGKREVVTYSAPKLIRQLNREKRKGQLFQRQDVTGAARQYGWTVEPNPGQLRDKQLVLAGALSKAGAMKASAPKCGEMLPVEGSGQPKVPFGCYVSTQIAGGHRVQNAAAPGNERRPLVFKELLHVKPKYIGETVLFATVPSEYQIQIRNDGLLVDKKGKLVNAENAKFVLNEYGDWFMVNIYENKLLHHSFFTRGGPVGMAGYMRVKDGRFESYEARSGHYQPQQENIAEFEKYLAATNLQGLKRRECLVRRQPVQSNVPLLDSPMVYGDLPQSHPAKLPADYVNDADKWAEDLAMQRLKMKRARPAIAEPAPPKEDVNENARRAFAEPTPPEDYLNDPETWGT